MEVSRSVFGQSPLANIELAVLEHLEFVSSVPAVDPSNTCTNSTSGKSPTKTTQRSGEESTENTEVVQVQTVGQTNQLDTIRGVAVEGSTEKEDSQESTNGTTDGIDTVEEVELGDQTEQEGRDTSDSGKIGNEEDFENVDVLDGKNDGGDVDANKDGTAPPDVETTEEDIVLNGRDLGTLEGIVSRRTETACKNDNNTGDPVGQGVDDVEESERTVVLSSRAVEETRPPSERTSHTDDEADGKEGNSGESNRKVQGLVVLGSESTLPETLVEHLTENEGSSQDVPELSTKTLRLEQAGRLDASVVNVEIDANSNRSDDDEYHDDDGVDVVSVERSLETTVSGVDGRDKRNDQGSNGRVHTTENVDGGAVRVELDKHEAEHEADKDEGRKNTNGPSVSASDVLRERETIRADASDLRTEPSKGPERCNGRETVGGETKDTGVGDDGQLWVTEEER